jgi:hypothetical protein
MPRDCPVCGLVSPDEARSCDCGYSFAYAGSVGRLQLGAAARRNMVVGGLVCIAGATVLLLCLGPKEVSPFALYAGGAILSGGAVLLRGLMQARTNRRRAERQQEADPSE